MLGEVKAGVLEEGLIYWKRVLGKNSYLSDDLARETYAETKVGGAHTLARLLS